MKQKIAVLFLAMTMVFVLGGCNSVNFKMNEKKIIKDSIEYLTDKYDCEFEALSARLIIDPAEGSVVNVVCKDKTYNRPFRVFHSMDSSSLTIEGDENELSQELEKAGKAKITDEYGGLVLAEKYAQKLKKQFDENVFVFCEISFNEFMPSTTDIHHSFDQSIKNWQANAFSKIFIFYDEKSDLQAILQAATNFVPKYKLAMQYVYICHVSTVDEADIMAKYNDNWNQYEDFIVDDNSVDKIDAFYTTSDDGVKNIQVIKE